MYNSTYFGRAKRESWFHRSEERGCRVNAEKANFLSASQELTVAGLPVSEAKASCERYFPGRQRGGLAVSDLDSESVMKAVVGVFKSRSDAERGGAELAPLEIPKDLGGWGHFARFALYNRAPMRGVADI